MIPHTHSCPHECEACAKKSRWHVDIWANGGCVVCGAADRKGNTWGCTKCWVDLPANDREAAMIAVQ